MALSITINGGSYALPLSVQDITLSTHLKVVQAEKDMPEELKHIFEADTEAERKERASKLQKRIYARKVIPYFASIISALTGIPTGQLLGDRFYEGAPVGLIEEWYWLVMRSYARYEYDAEQRVFQIGGKTWTLPQTHMVGSTYGQFAEAAQYEEYVADVAAGNWEQMPYVMAVLLRPEGEKFDPYTWDGIAEARADIMRGLPMSVVYQVSFFLLKRNESLKLDSEIYTVARLLARSKREVEALRKTSAGILA
jgi:hypothetical protein